jgi:hypothetical protein
LMTADTMSRPQHEKSRTPAWTCPSFDRHAATLYLAGRFAHPACLDKWCRLRLDLILPSRP